MRTEPRTLTFDAFGEPVETVRGAEAGAGARRAVLAVFWALAFLLMGTRVYFADQLSARPHATVASVGTPVQ
jgi:hypothetical protein